MAHVLTVNLGTPRDSAHARLGRTGIDKKPVEHPVLVAAPGPKGTGGSGLAGDSVCDLRHHGGADQAVYAYAREDLDTWAAEFGRPLSNGSFGENLTTSGIDLTNTLIGETWSVGDDVVLQISDPRIPCRTFAGWLGEQAWMRRFTERAVCGSYLRVIRGGHLRSGDTITVLSRPDHDVTVSMAFRALTTDPGLLPRLIAVDGLSAEARGTAARRSGQPEGLHPLGVPLLQPAEQRGDPGQIPRSGHDQLGQGVPIGDHVLGLGDRLPQQSAAPQRERPGQPRIGLARLADLAHSECRVTGIAEHLEHQVPGDRIEPLGDLPVEVGRQPVTDVRLDQ